MTELQQMFYRELRPHAIIHGNPVQQLVLRIGLAIDKYSRYPDMVQAFLILTCDTGRCDEDSINPPAVEGFDIPHLMRELLDALSCVCTNQCASTKCP